MNLEEHGVNAVSPRLVPKITISARIPGSTNMQQISTGL